MDLFTSELDRRYPTAMGALRYLIAVWLFVVASLLGAFGHWIGAVIYVPSVFMALAAHRVMHRDNHSEKRMSSRAN